jgi:nicotinamidase-related amidase
VTPALTTDAMKLRPQRGQPRRPSSATSFDVARGAARQRDRHGGDAHRSIVHHAMAPEHRLDGGRKMRYERIMKHAFGLSVPQKLEDVCNPRDLALIVYDMQVGIVRQVKDGAAITARVHTVLEMARAAGLRVCFTRHMSLPRELMGAFQYRMAMSWQRVESPDQVEPWFLRDSPSFAIVPELLPRPSEAIFDKITMSAFEATPLAITLRDCGIRAVALVGLALEVGIEPTARHAADLGFIPILVTDACGAGHEEAGRRSLEALAFAGDAILSNTDELRQALRP